MTGHWTVCKHKYSQLEFIFNTGSYFWTTTRNLTTCLIEFLSLKVIQDKLNKLGIDILSNPKITNIFNVYPPTSRKNICSFLMDQKYFAGIGNYLKAVILYRCRISPYRQVKDITEEEKWNIWVTTKIVAKEAIKKRGMGMRDYKDENGNKIGVAFDITPYRMKYDKEGYLVLCEKIAGRTTWWVPEKQI